MMISKIAIPQDEIAAFCERHHIRKLSLFGSVLRDDFRPDSDVDVLVEFEPGHVPGFIRLSRMRLELSEILGWEADLRTPDSLSDYFRKNVEAKAIKLYEQ
jgi:predicted nucleotidyltransferase